MGITGEIVRSVFSKIRSVQRQESHGHQASSIDGAEKKKWSSSVRSYLCGDEHNSVLAAEDSASVTSSAVAEVDLTSFRSNRSTNITSNVERGYITTSVYAEDDTASLRSSEATVNQPLHGHSDSKDESQKEKHNSTYKLFQQEDAALIIQSAFKSFRAGRRAQDGPQTQDDKSEPSAGPSRESIGTSIEVQTGKSSDIFSIKEEGFDVRQTMRHRNKAQVLKFQEDWDDSTVSSVISKMRMQNRLEAATRRERALAYAFSQQLRICSKNKQIMANGDETKTGWSWLERWMAARQPEMTLIEDSITCSQKTLVRKKRSMQDAAAMEEKESSGSNEVCSLVEVTTRNVPRPAKTSTSKVTTSFSTQNSTSSHLCPGELKDEKKKRTRPKQPGGNKRDIKHSTTQVSVEYDIKQ